MSAQFVDLGGVAFRIYQISFSAFEKADRTPFYAMGGDFRLGVASRFDFRCGEKRTCNDFLKRRLSVNTEEYGKNC